MIKIRGTRKALAGEEVCLTAHNVGKGFVAHTRSSGSKVKITVKINKADDTATICFTMPEAGELVTIIASNGTTGENTSHTVVSQ